MRPNSRVSRWMPALAAVVAVAAVLAMGARAGARRAPEPGARAAAPAEVGDPQPAAAYIPFIVRRYGFETIAQPPTAPPPTETPTPSPTATATDTPSPTPTPEDCPPLEERVTIRQVNVSPKEVQLSLGGLGWDRTRHVTLAMAPDGSFRVVWTDTDGQTWLTPLTANFTRAGKDQWVDGKYIRGLVVLADGPTLVVRRNDDDMFLLHLDHAGTKIWDTQIVGQQGHTVVGSKWADDWGHEGRLVWTGTHYFLYMGHTQYFGARGKHQGDLMRVYDADGQLVADGLPDQPAWEWGCSHSLDLRLAISHGKVGGICLSDEYPAKAMVFNHGRIVRAEPSGDGGGHSDGELGGLIAGRTGFWFSYASNVGRKTHDVGLVHLTEEGERQEELWITNTPAIEETAAHVARHGSNVFVAWAANGKYLGEIVTPEGKVLEGPVDLGAEFGARDDLINLPNGDIAWAYAWGNMKAISVVRVGYCSRALD